MQLKNIPAKELAIQIVRLLTFCRLGIITSLPKRVKRYANGCREIYLQTSCG